MNYSPAYLSRSIGTGDSWFDRNKRPFYDWATFSARIRGGNTHVQPTAQEDVNSESTIGSGWRKALRAGSDENVFMPTFAEFLEANGLSYMTVTETVNEDRPTYYRYKGSYYTAKRKVSVTRTKSVLTRNGEYDQYLTIKAYTQYVMSSGKGTMSYDSKGNVIFSPYPVVDIFGNDYSKSTSGSGSSSSSGSGSWTVSGPSGKSASITMMGYYSTVNSAVTSAISNAVSSGSNSNGGSDGE